MTSATLDSATSTGFLQDNTCLSRTSKNRTSQHLSSGRTSPLTPPFTPSQEKSTEEDSSNQNGSHDLPTKPSPDLAKPDDKPQESSPDTNDEPLCRICLGGRDDEDSSLGRFIQPCLCRGTMAYIHVGCLQRWRTTAPSSKSFYRCDQCGYTYRLQRATAVGLAENKAILGFVTMLLFYLLVTLAGYAAEWLLEGQVSHINADDGWNYGFGGLSYDSTGRFVGEAVGEAVRVLNNKLLINLDVPDRPNPRAAREADQLNTLQSIPTKQDEPHTYRYVNPNSRAKRLPDQDPGGGLLALFRLRTRTKAVTESTSDQDPYRGQSLKDVLASKVESLAWYMLRRLENLIRHSILGLALIGILSFFQLLMSLTFMSPFNFGIRHSILRMMRTHNRPGSRDPSGMGSIIVLTFLVVGLATAIRGVWCFVRRCSQWLLRKVEDRVLDVRS